MAAGIGSSSHPLSWFWKHITYSATAVLFICAVAHAASLEDEYGQRQKRRSELERRREDFERSFDTLIEERHHREMVFSNCADQKWAMFWEPRRRRIESARVRLEKRHERVEDLRADLQQRNRALEESREALEDKHRSAHNAAYAHDLRQHMAALDAYLERM